MLLTHVSSSPCSAPVSVTGRPPRPPVHPEDWIAVQGRGREWEVRGCRGEGVGGEGGKGRGCGR